MGRVKPFRYEKRRTRGTLTINQLDHLGGYREAPAQFKVMRFRLDKRLADMKKWKFLEARDGATFFKLPNGMKVIIKPELWVPFPPMKVGKRNSNRQPRRMLTVLNELSRRGVDIEHPIGELVAKNKQVFYITKVEKGIHLADIINAHPSHAELSKIATSMGVFLATMHKKGVLHGHPHDHNWLVHNGKAKLIDVKGISFREEYPWKTNTGRVRTFEGLAQEEATGAATWLPASVQDIMLAAYRARMVKK